MRTANIFHLLNRFGPLEDQISAGFGFVLQANVPVLRALLHRLRLPGALQFTGHEMREIEIETQVSYSAAETPDSRIDLQIRWPGRFIAFLESKLGYTRLGTGQLDKYARLLRDVRGEYDSVRLVLVTQFERAMEAQHLARSLHARAGVKRGEFFYLRWEDIRRMIAEAPATSRTRAVNDLFLDYVGDMMSDRKVMKDQVVGKVPEVLVVATAPDWWELAQKKRIAIQANGTPDARYVAFYRLKPVSAITHIAEVEATEKNVRAREILHGFPRILAKAKQRGWIDKPQKVYRLKELVPLPVTISRRGGAAYRVKALKTMTDLLKARYLSDLFREQRARKGLRGRPQR
jgi:hypothetical protein